MNYFNFLPDDVIERCIFALLKGGGKRSDWPSEINSDLKSLSLTCKRFNEIIGDSSLLMSDFCLQLATRCFVDGPMRPPPVVARKYSRCELFGIVEQFHEECFAAVRIYGKSIKVLTIYGSLPMQTHTSIFHHTPSVHKINFYNVRQEMYACSNLSPADVPLLKKITIVNHPDSILHIFANFNIECLKVYTTMPFTFPPTVAWRLRELCVDTAVVDNFVSLLNVLHRQSAYLEDLDVHANSLIADFIVREMKNLKTLRMTFNALSLKSIIFDNFSNDTVMLRKLVLIGNQRLHSNALLIRLLQHFSSVETLELHTFSNNNNGDRPVIVLPNLRTLEVREPENFVLQNATMSRLERLTVHDYRLRTVPSRTVIGLKELIIHDLKIDIRDIIVCYPNLEVLELGNAFVRGYHLSSILCSLPRLRCLKVKRSSWQVKRQLRQIPGYLNRKIEIYLY